MNEVGALLDALEKIECAIKLVSFKLSYMLGIIVIIMIMIWLTLNQ
jgi:hypothetical protein